MQFLIVYESQTASWCEWLEAESLEEAIDSGEIKAAQFNWDVSYVVLSDTQAKAVVTYLIQENNLELR